MKDYEVLFGGDEITANQIIIKPMPQPKPNLEQQVQVKEKLDVTTKVVLVTGIFCAIVFLINFALLFNAGVVGLNQALMQEKNFNKSLRTEIKVSRPSIIDDIPATPSRLSVEGVSPTDNYLYWEASSGAAYYIVIYHTESLGPDWLPAVLPYPIYNNYYHHFLDVNTKYEYRVAACNQMGQCSGYSDIATATTRNNLLLANADTPWDIYIWWAPSEPVSNLHYEVQYKKAGPDMAWQFLNGTGYSWTNYIYHHFVDPDSTYEYRVAVCGELQGVSYCSNYSQSTHINTPPSLLEAVPQSPTEIGVYWAEADDPDFYMLEYRNLTLGTDWEVDYSNINSYYHQNLTPNTTYEYKVAACGTINYSLVCSNYTDSARASTPPEL